MVSYYRIWKYPLAAKSCKHIYFRRDRGWRDHGREAGDGEAGPETTTGRLPENLIRARRNVRDLILCNPFEFFCTFTFNAEKIDRYDFPRCKKRLSQLFNDYKKRYAPNFRYLVVPEFHKDGAVHFHGVVRGIRPEDLTVPETIWKRDKKTDNLEKAPNTRKYVDWSYYSKKLGFFSCSRIRNPEKCAWYVSKYITKDLVDLPLGGNLYLASKGLSRPELIFDCDDVPMTFQPEYQDEFVMMAYQPEETTYGVYVPLWLGDCCAELKDPPEEEPAAEPFGPRLTGSQLRFWRQSLWTWD